MKSKIPTLLGIFLLVVSITSAVFIAKAPTLLNSFAAPDLRPQDVKITNITDASITISWLTQQRTIGFVEYSNGSTSNLTPPTENSFTHFTTIQNLAKDTSYYFRINSQGNFFDNSGIKWSTKTAANMLPKIIQISGRVLDKNLFPAKNALIYVTANKEVYSTIVKESGNWILSLPQLDSTTLLAILVENSVSELASSQIEIGAANPVPDMTIGNSYDFRNQKNEKDLESPKVPLSLP